MNKLRIHQWITWCIGLVWLINGLICKVLNLVPRHQLIVANILCADHARTLTFLIGIAEIVMAIWVWSRLLRKWNAVTQMAVVIIMNTLEFALVPDLLLFGRANAVFALLFVFVIYYNEFVLNKQTAQSV